MIIQLNSSIKTFFSDGNQINVLDGSLVAHLKHLKSVWFHEKLCIGYCDVNNLDSGSFTVKVVTPPKECDNEKLFNALSSRIVQQQARIESVLDRFEAGMKNSLVLVVEEKDPSWYEKSKE